MTTRKKIGTAMGFLATVLAVVTLFLWRQQINVVAIPEDRTLFVVAFLSATVLGVASFVVGTRWYGGIAALPGILIGLLVPFTVSISEQIVADNPIAVGDTIPRFIAIDDEGERFDSHSLNGHITLIKFFRAHW